MRTFTLDQQRKNRKNSVHNNNDNNNKNRKTVYNEQVIRNTAQHAG